MTKAEREALREMLAGPKVEWTHETGLISAGSCYWLGERYAVQVYEQGIGNWVWWISKTSRMLRQLGTGHSLPTLEAAKTAAQAWLANHFLPHRRAVLDLLDWADKAEAWARRWEEVRWTTDFEAGYDTCTACGILKEEEPRLMVHAADCPFGDDHAELFGEEAEADA